MSDMREALTECHKLDELTEEFTLMAMNHCHIYLNKKQHIPYSAREEAQSDFCFRLVKSWRNISPDKSPFSYLTSMASSSLIDVQRKFDARRRRCEAIKGVQTTDFYEVFNHVTPKVIDLARMKAGEKSILRRQLIKYMRKGVTKCELSRVTGIHRRTLIRWEQGYNKYGSKFCTMDRRIHNRRPFK